MFTAVDLIEYLRARVRYRPQSAQRPFGEFPPTWRLWFLSMPVRDDAVIGAPVADFIAEFRSRPLRAPPPKRPTLGRLGGLTRLFRQQWERPSRDQRGQRFVAGTLSVFLNLLFAVVFLWRGTAPMEPIRTEQPGEAVMVEFIGEGTPAEQGGAPASGETNATPASEPGVPSVAATTARATQVEAAQATSASIAPPEMAPPEAPPPVAVAAQDTPAQTSPEAAPEEPAPPVPAPPVAEQPLAVTERPAPDAEFVLPPPTPRSVRTPQLQMRTPELHSRVEQIETAEPHPQVRALEQRPQQRAPTAPALRSQVAEIEVIEPRPQVRELTQRQTPRAPSVPAIRSAAAEIEMHEPLPQVRAQGTPTNTMRTPQLRAPTMRGAPGEVPLRDAAPAASASAQPTQATPAPAARTPGNTGVGGPAQTPSATRGGQPSPTPGAGRPAGTANRGAGPSPGPRPGATPSQVRGDDWGVSDRNVPGGAAGRTPGLYNSDGTVRLPGDGGRVAGGLPPGTIIEDFDKIDRMGTWLKRPPFDYTPTRFDQFWTPGRTLLEEWVSRGIKTVFVPIPGTTKRLQCTVSLLQAGGSCSISDPNLQDQEAIARPPPDVPFKPELQEDRGSLKGSGE